MNGPLAANLFLPLVKDNASSNCEITVSPCCGSSSENIAIHCCAMSSVRNDQRLPVTWTVVIAGIAGTCHRHGLSAIGEFS